MSVTGYSPCVCGTWPSPADARAGVCAGCHDYRPNPDAGGDEAHVWDEAAADRNLEALARAKDETENSAWSRGWDQGAAAVRRIYLEGRLQAAVLAASLELSPAEIQRAVDEALTLAASPDEGEPEPTEHKESG